jgi:Spy/CpxP family protein refolding chaperone
MNLRSFVVAGCFVIVALWSGGLARAQQAGAQRGGQPGMRAGMRGAAGAGALTPAELERWLDSYILLQAQETLKLTDAQFPQFVQRLKALQETRRRNLQARRQMINSLGPLLKATPVDQAQVRERLKQLHDLNIRSAEELQRAYDGIDEVLDAAQQARFRLFEEAAERRKIELLMRARLRGGQQGQPEPSGIR